MAEHFGIYALSGALMQTNSTNVVVAEDLTTNRPGTVVDLLPSSSSIRSFGNEVVNHNAWKTTEVESIDGQAWRDVYLSKRNVDASSTLQFRTFTFKRIPTIYDIFLNPPDTAPTASSVIAAGIPGSPAASNVIIGTTINAVPAGDLDPLNFEIQLDSAFESSQNIIASALSGNIIVISEVGGPNSFSATVIDPQLNGVNHRIRLSIPDGFSSRSMEFAAGSTVKLFSWVALSSSVSGVFLNSTNYAPASLPIVVDQQGKIRDIKVWMEFIHDDRSVGGHGLQSTQISLRSPNTSFLSAHPLWNSPAADRLPLRTTSSLDDRYYQIPELLRNSYLLWAGHRVDIGLADSIDTSNFYHEFDNDIDMRTVFWDGSSARNPRDLTMLFPSASALSAGNPLSYSSVMSGSNPSYLSPSLAAFNANFIGTAPSLTGSTIPWMLDNQGGTISMGAIASTTSSLTGSAFVPVGWNTDGINEFHTSGTNFGPTSIKPVYPLLDDIIAYKVTDQSPTVPGAFSLPTSHGPIRGTRPGLRGTETSGTWSVLVGTQPDSYNQSQGYYHASSGSGVWFRQARLEFVVDSNIGLFEFTPSRSRKWLKTTLVPGADGYQNISIVSGSTAWDPGLVLIQRNQGQDYGRTVSISDDLAVTSYAVLTVITGTLSSSLAALGVSNPPWYLGANGFGTPYIPDSSMSLGNLAAEQIDASASAEMFNQTVGQATLIPNANTLTDFLKREGYSVTTEQRWGDFIKSLNSGTSL